MVPSSQNYFNITILPNCLGYMSVSNIIGNTTTQNEDLFGNVFKMLQKELYIIEEGRMVLDSSQIYFNFIIIKH